MILECVRKCHRKESQRKGGTRECNCAINSLQVRYYNLKYPFLYFEYSLTCLSLNSSKYICAYVHAPTPVYYVAYLLAEKKHHRPLLFIRAIDIGQKYAHISLASISACKRSSVASNAAQ